MLAGSGTGTVIGQWIWDEKVVEQFSASIIGGRSTTIKTRQSLPTWSLGGHTLQLRMVQPNQVATKPIEIVINPGDWKLEQLIQPASGASFGPDAPPHLLWAPVPGVMKYQVGFSSKPDPTTISEWFDVTENNWQVPAEVWKKLPEGEIFWTIRAVDPSGCGAHAAAYGKDHSHADGCAARAANHAHGAPPWAVTWRAGMCCADIPQPV